MKVVLEMFFLYFSNTNIYFDIKEFTWKTYTIVKTISISKRVELIDKYDYIQAVLEENSETFVVHVATLEVLKSAELAIYPSWLGQILTKVAQLAAQ